MFEVNLCICCVGLNLWWFAGGVVLVIQIRLKKKFNNTTDAWRYLMSVVNPGDESEFESYGKEKKKYTGPVLEDEIESMGLHET